MSNHSDETSIDQAPSRAVRGTQEASAIAGDPTTHEARDALRDSLLETARWRREKVEQFSKGNRNAEAAELLIALAETVATADRDIMIRYGAHLENQAIGLGLHETQSELLRAIGFRAWPETAEEIVQQILEKAAELIADIEADEASDA